MPERLFSTYQVADLLDATPGAVVEWIQKGLLPVQRTSDGPLRISEKGLVQFLKSRGADVEKVMAKAAVRTAANPGEGPKATPSRPSVPKPAIQKAPHETIPMIPSDDEAPSREEAESILETDLSPPDVELKPAPPTALPADAAAEDEPVEPHPTPTNRLDSGPLSDTQVSVALTAESLENAERQEEVDLSAQEEPPVVEKPKPEAEPRQAAPSAVEPPGPATSSPTPPIASFRERTQPRPALRPVEPVEIEMPRPADSPAGQVEPEITYTPPPAARHAVSAPTSPLEGLVAQALARRASDIHLETTERDSRLRLRVDGMLQAFPLPAPPDSLIAQLTSLAGLDASRRFPQSGRLRLNVGGQEISSVASMCPIVGGLRIVLALQPRRAEPLELLGLPNGEQSFLARLLGQDGGLIILTCPPGRQRDSALRAMIGAMGAERRNVATVGRSNVGRWIGATAVAIEPGGLSFSQALRALSEQDADALVVEDIRDGQTGLAMLEATEAGRLVVGATSAANPAAAIDMLLEMGLEPWTLAASLRAIISHAQVRRLCEKCRTPAEPSEQLLAGMGLSRLELDFRPFAPGACQDCGHSGYAGLAGLSSAMFIDKSLASLIRLGRDEELGEAAQRQGLRSLRQIALDMVRDGVTSLEELSRIMPE